MKTKPYNTDMKYFILCLVLLLSGCSSTWDGPKHGVFLVYVDDHFETTYTREDKIRIENYAIQWLELNGLTGVSYAYIRQKNNYTLAEMVQHIENTNYPAFIGMENYGFVVTNNLGDKYRKTDESYKLLTKNKVIGLLEQAKTDGVF